MIPGPYSDILSGSLGTTVRIPGLMTGLGGPVGSSLVGGFPNMTTLGNVSGQLRSAPASPQTAQGRGRTMPRPTLNSSSKFLAQDRVGDFTKYLTSRWAAGLSYTAPVTLSLSGDLHAFPFIDGKLGLDDGGVKATGAAGATAAALTGKHGLDVFFADANGRQSGSEPARLLLFGATLVGRGVVIRRRMRGDATPKL
jgi:hypothetical protein